MRVPVVHASLIIVKRKRVHEKGDCSRPAVSSYLHSSHRCTACRKRPCWRSALPFQAACFCIREAAREVRLNRPSVSPILRFAARSDAVARDDSIHMLIRGLEYAKFCGAGKENFELLHSPVPETDED